MSERCEDCSGTGEYINWLCKYCGGTGMVEPTDSLIEAISNMIERLEGGSDYEGELEALKLDQLIECQLCLGSGTTGPLEVPCPECFGKGWYRND